MLIPEYIKRKEKFIMNKLLKIFSYAAVSAMVLCIGTGAFAQFSDMPEGEMGVALQNAVDAGLMDGVSDDSIAPYDYITRAQMATIITRAFSAEDKSEQTFGDVKNDAWYADAVSKAVAMGAFEGDDDNNFNPENNITFQETYIVLSRVFAFEPYELKYQSGETLLLGDCDASVLDKFSDKDQIASWAVDGTKYIVGNGGWEGIDGLLKPTDNITRGEFAIIMDALVETYIDEPGTYTDLPDGLTMVRCGGVTIDGLQTSHNLIITYGVDESGCKIVNSTVNGVTLVLGGADTAAKAKGAELPDNSYVSIQGNFYDVRVNAPYVYLDANAASVSYYKGVERSLVGLSFS